MLAKIFAWVMLVINICMALYVITTPQGDLLLWMVFIFGSELFMNIKYLESLK